MPLELQEPVLIFPFPSIVVAEGKAIITCIKWIAFRRYENLHHGTQSTVLKKKKKKATQRQIQCIQSVRITDESMVLSNRVILPY